MNNRDGRKDSIRFDETQDILSMRAEAGLELTDEELDAALARLHVIVQNEPVSSRWKTTSADLSESDQEMSHGDMMKPTMAYSSTIEERSITPMLSGQATPEPIAVRSRRRSFAARRFAKVGYAVAAAAVVVGLCISPVGGKVMAAAMNTMYFQNLFGVGEADMTQIQNALDQVASGNGGRVDLKQYGTAQVDRTPVVNSNMTLTQATQAANVPMKTLPGYDTKNGSVNYVPGSSVTLRLNVNAINALIQQLGGKTEFPSSVNGEPIVIEIPAQVNEDVSNPGGADTELNEMQMPSIQVPSDVDLNQIRLALIDLPFLPQDIRDSLSTSEQWQQTLYVPDGGNGTNTTVNGNPAVVNQWQSGGFWNSMMWLQNGVLYQLSGSTAAFPNQQALIQLAKELSQ